MSGQASFSLRGRNPDVLTCIANLSNDEVFTPPEFANRMLDNLAGAWAANNDGADLWADSTVRFLDPFTKSGVFLREITSRLTNGLAAEIPDLQERVNHILTRQIFGIGITRLTSFLARRSLYCSKHANGPHSIAKAFAIETGNIWFERMEHTWVDGRCKFCGASQKTLDRGDELETHAYAFIHTDNIKTRLAAFGYIIVFPNVRSYENRRKFPTSKRVRPAFPPQIRAPAPAIKANGIVAVRLSCQLKNSNTRSIKALSRSPPTQYERD